VKDAPRRLCRRYRHQRQHPHEGQGDPPRDAAFRGAMRSTAFRVKRSRDRIQSLGFFQDKLEIEQKPGSAPDRVVLGDQRRGRKSTGELQVSGGLFEPRELHRQPLDHRTQLHGARGRSFAPASIIPLIRNRSIWASRSHICSNKNIRAWAAISSAATIIRSTSSNSNRNTTYQQTTTRLPGPSGRAADRVHQPRAALWAQLRRTCRSIKNTFYSNRSDHGGVRLRSAGLRAAICAIAIGQRTTSSVGYSLVFR